ncbi:uncharacterized protein BX664DRAFT_320267 [Halteromyces radiatus]|uniref:uncharacterized protein n=1 Tax=Halteromyces radiatus TaxID=101107 RepID=UPI002220C727|nr:uncharacterized protein BX664DRAFT_320267 [Halteromyces radiatus]KAI8099052.1 hypothetical protein BX664DRAFT_320267 [Halteromyces radiatus]
MGKSVEQTMNNPFTDKSVEIHTLSRNEEEACFKDLKAKALQHCQDSVKDFVECSKEHNVTVMWTCRSKLKTMNSCLNERTSREELDKLKLIKMAEKRARQQQQQAASSS